MRVAAGAAGERVVHVLGIGGLAREIAWLIESQWVEGARAVLVSKSQEAALGDDALMVPGMGDPVARLALLDHYSAASPRWATLVSDRALVGTGCAIGRGAVIAAGTTVTVDASVGAGTMLNLHVTVGHEARIGAACMVNPSANISGGAVIGDGVLVGTGAQILEGVVVGDGAIVGAGAVVTRDVQPGVTVVGAPARPLERR